MLRNIILAKFSYIGHPPYINPCGNMKKFCP